MKFLSKERESELQRGGKSAQDFDKQQPNVQRVQHVFDDKKTTSIEMISAEKTPSDSIKSLADS